MGRSRVLECLEGILDRREPGTSGALRPADQLANLLGYCAVATDVGRRALDRGHESRPVRGGQSAQISHEGKAIERSHLNAAVLVLKSFSRFGLTLSIVACRLSRRSRWVSLTSTRGVLGRRTSWADGI